MLKYFVLGKNDSTLFLPRTRHTEASASADIPFSAIMVTCALPAIPRPVCGLSRCEYLSPSNSKYCSRSPEVATAQFESSSVGSKELDMPPISIRQPLLDAGGSPRSNLHRHQSGIWKTHSFSLRRAFDLRCNPLQCRPNPNHSFSGQSG